MSEPVRLRKENSIALIEVSNPPVNALSHAVRTGLQECIRTVAGDDTISAAVIIGAGRTFIAGADIREFGQPPKDPLLPEVVNQIEACGKPVVAALHGTVLGGGLEVALGAHYRIAAPGTKLGLPEVSLGLLPGAGGTQRLPRLVPLEKAVGMITSGKPVDAAEALELGLVDRMSGDADVNRAAIRFAEELVAGGHSVRPVRDLPVPEVPEGFFDAVREKVSKAAKGQIAPVRAVEAVKAALDLPFEDGLAQERAIFRELMETDQRAALIHAFFSERQVGKIPEMETGSPREVTRIGVIGGGTMGSGIAASALMSGFDVTLIEQNDEAAERAKSTVTRTLGGAVKRGKLTQAALDDILADKCRTGTDYDALADADLVIEAVFESMDVKRDVFTALDRVCKDGAILATNTSYLDVNEIAAFTGRPADVIGLHFFSPAHVMRLLEIVVAGKTSPDVTATGFALAKRLGKIGVRAGVCDGFIGNRILAHYRKALDGAVLAGASPFDVDRALTGFGLAMGPFAVSDLAGLDIGWATRKRLAPARDRREVYAEFADRLCEAGHFGRKTGKGYYVYGEDGTVPNEDVLTLISEERANKGIVPRELSDDEIVARYMAAMISEAARIVGEGIALRPLDVDVTLLNGYGFPRWRGGPMHYADTVGLEKILSDIKAFAAEDDYLWQPAPLLEKLVAEGRTFSSLNR